MNPPLNEPEDNRSKRRCSKSEQKSQREPINIRKWQTGTTWTDCRKPLTLRIKESTLRDIVDDYIVEMIRGNVGYKEDGSTFLSEDLETKIDEWKSFAHYVATTQTTEGFSTFLEILNEGNNFEIILGTIHLFPLNIDLEMLRNLQTIFDNIAFQKMFIHEIDSDLVDSISKLEVYIKEIETAISKHLKPPRES